MPANMLNGDRICRSRREKVRMKCYGVGRTRQTREDAKDAEAHEPPFHTNFYSTLLPFPLPCQHRPSIYSNVICTFVTVLRSASARSLTVFAEIYTMETFASEADQSHVPSTTTRDFGPRSDRQLRHSLRTEGRGGLRYCATAMQPYEAVDDLHCRHPKESPSRPLGGKWT